MDFVLRHVTVGVLPNGSKTNAHIYIYIRYTTPIPLT